MQHIDVDRRSPISGLTEAAAVLSSGRASIWLVGLDEVTVDPDQSRLPNLAILASLSALGIWLVLRRLRSGRLP